MRFMSRMSSCSCSIFSFRSLHRPVTPPSHQPSPHYSKTYTQQSPFWGLLFDSNIRLGEGGEGIPQDLEADVELPLDHGLLLFQLPRGAAKSSNSSQNTATARRVSSTREMRPDMIGDEVVSKETLRRSGRRDVVWSQQEK
jgi:hypothetical protein